MAFAFDQCKAASNADKHGVGFDAFAGFEFETAIVDATGLGGEPRLQAIGLIGRRLHVAVYTVERGIRLSGSQAG